MNQLKNKTLYLPDHSPVVEMLQYIFAISLLFFAAFTTAQEQKIEGREFYAPLTDTTNITIEGASRFVTINGLTGFQPTSLHTRVYIETHLHQGERGTISFWFSPMEDLDFFPNAGKRVKEDEDVFDYPFISDVYPPRKDIMNFGIFWHNADPQLLVKFAPGGIWSAMDYIVPPYTFIEKVPLHAGHWYQLTLTWDRIKGMIDIYVNGILMGFNHEAGGFMDSNDRLYIGCPMIVMRELTINRYVLPDDKIKMAYQKQRQASGGVIDAEIARLTTPAFGPKSDLKLDSSWQKVYSCPFTKKSNLDGWRFQTDSAYLDSMIVKTTPEGLYFKTPDKIDNTTRLTLWGPKDFEGDQCMEVEFRLESPKGLALIILCASGMGREDFIDDHGLEMTGNMSPILSGTRNYHWEFMRRVNVIRTDMETQVVYKNPWGKHLYYGVIPKIEQGRWYKLRLIKISNRLQGTIDGHIVFDVEDHADRQTGPIYNFGRIGLRHMYQTAIYYRNLAVYERENN